jgi:hypothetical protein
MASTGTTSEKKKRRSGIPTGNAGEYFVMGELLRQGYDAQLADRNTKGYDLLVGDDSDTSLRKVQVKSVRGGPWFVRVADFSERPNQVTVYVIVGKDGTKPVRYFIARNRQLAKHVTQPATYTANGFVSLKAVRKFENNWKIVGAAARAKRGEIT